MAEIVRVARDKGAVIVKANGTYNRVSADLSKIDSAASLAELTSGASWRRPTPEDFNNFTEHAALAAGEVVVESKQPAPERQIRLPKSVQRSLAECATTMTSDPKMQKYIEHLASSTTTTASQVTWLYDNVIKAHTTYNNLGGDHAYQWFLKMEQSGTLTAAGAPFEPSDDLEYFGISDKEGDTKVTGLIAVNRADDLVLSWTPEGFIPAPESVSEYDSPSIIEIDADSASAIAVWVNEGGNAEEGFDITAVVAGEQNLFEMALAEGDEWANVDTLSALIADAVYTPQERSSNAQRQQRQTGGKFGGPQLEEQPQTLNSFAKAHLPIGLELLVDVAGRIQEYLAAAGPASPPQTPAAPVEDAPVVAALSPDDPTVAPLYLALVDPVDNTAVLDIAAILPDESGAATAWVRSDGAWTPRNELLADLQGATPPPVVELTDEPTIKDVLSQVDAFDAEAPAPDDAARADAPLVAGACSTLYGEYGEILPSGVLLAAGIPGIADTPTDKAATERLMRYWAFGPGAAKIRWGTKGDLTRAHRYLSKYVGPKRAWGLAQNLHKRVFGVPNRTHDKATGQI